MSKLNSIYDLLDHYEYSFFSVFLYTDEYYYFEGTGYDYIPEKSCIYRGESYNKTIETFLEQQGKIIEDFNNSFLEVYNNYKLKLLANGDDYITKKIVVYAYRPQQTIPDCVYEFYATQIKN